MISSIRFVLSATALAATMVCANAQSVTNVSPFSYQMITVSDGEPARMLGGVSAFTKRAPDTSNVTLEEVRTSHESTAQAIVTVFNPTSSPIDANIRLLSVLVVGGTFGDWGPGVDESNLLHVPIPALQPGETRAVTWSDVRATSSVHTPTTTVGGLWSDVLNSCLGKGQVEYGTFLGVDYQAVTPSSVEVLSVELTADVGMELQLTSSLTSNAGAVPYCPNPIFGSSAPATMEALGTLNAWDLDHCLLRTSFVPEGLPAVAYVTTEPANLPSAAGSICLGGQRVFRSEPQLGSSTAPLDFRLEPLFGAIGSTVYAQTFYRTAQQGLRVTGAIELPLQ